MGKLKDSARLFREFIGYSRASRAYWLIPLIILMAAMGLLVVASQAVTPFIYALF